MLMLAAACRYNMKQRDVPKPQIQYLEIHGSDFFCEILRINTGVLIQETISFCLPASEVVSFGI